MNALIVEDCDNVVVATAEIPAGALVRYVRHDGSACEFPAVEDIPAYHKVAANPIPAGADVVKYGERIGTAACDIERGAHVHTHNVQDLS